MILRALADFVLCCHLGFVVFVLIGGFLVLWRRWFLWLHLPAALWGFIVEAAAARCPLTHLENTLRHRAGESGYPGGFVEHYLIPIIYPDGMTRELQIVLAVIVVAVNTAVYGWIFLRSREERRVALETAAEDRPEAVTNLPAAGSS